MASTQVCDSTMEATQLPLNATVLSISTLARHRRRCGGSACTSGTKIHVDGEGRDGEGEFVLCSFTQCDLYTLAGMNCEDARTKENAYYTPLSSSPDNDVARRLRIQESNSSLLVY